MMELWNWVNGKKTVLGIVAKAAVNVIAQMMPDMAANMTMMEGYIDMWILGGITHKMAKMEK